MIFRKKDSLIMIQIDNIIKDIEIKPIMILMKKIDFLIKFQI